MWTKMMGGPRKKAPKTIAVIDPDRCFGAFACSICQAACPVAGCIVEEPDRDGRMVCAVRADLCIGCGLCVTLGNPTAPQQREFGCPPDYDAINMIAFDDVVKMLQDNKARLVAFNECKADVACWSGKLKDQNPLVRERAAIELGHLNDPKSMPALLEALADKNLEARFAAIMAVDWVATQTKEGLAGAQKGLARLDEQIAAE